MRKILFAFAAIAALSFTGCGSSHDVKFAVPYGSWDTTGALTGKLAITPINTYTGSIGTQKLTGTFTDASHNVSTLDGSFDSASKRLTGTLTGTGSGASGQIDASLEDDGYFLSGSLDGKGYTANRSPGQ